MNHITDYGVTLLVESASVRLKLVEPDKRNCAAFLTLFPELVIEILVSQATCLLKIKMADACSQEEIPCSSHPRKSPDGFLSPFLGFVPFVGFLLKSVRADAF